MKGRLKYSVMVLVLGTVINISSFYASGPDAYSLKKEEITQKIKTNSITPKELSDAIVHLKQIHPDRGSVAMDDIRDFGVLLVEEYGLLEPFCKEAYNATSKSNASVRNVLSYFGGAERGRRDLLNALNELDACKARINQQKTDLERDNFALHDALKERDQKIAFLEAQGKFTLVTKLPQIIVTPLELPEFLVINTAAVSGNSEQISCLEILRIRLGTMDFADATAQLEQKKRELIIAAIDDPYEILSTNAFVKFLAKVNDLAPTIHEFLALYPKEMETPRSALRLGFFGFPSPPSSPKRVAISSEHLQREKNYQNAKTIAYAVFDVLFGYQSRDPLSLVISRDGTLAAIAREGSVEIGLSNIGQEEKIREFLEWASGAGQALSVSGFERFDTNEAAMTLLGEIAEKQPQIESSYVTIPEDK